MYDSYNRKIHYLRISVTDRCNLRCRYCMPAEGVQWYPHDEILSFETIREVVREAVSLGIDKFRLTGGEPLVRKGIVELVEMIASVEGVNDLSMTTNGQLLERYAADLKAAGLRRVNVSLDSLDPLKYGQLSRGGSPAPVLRGIEAAQQAGLSPVKINCVLTSLTTPDDRQALQDYCDARELQLRFIHQMDLHTGSFKPVEGGQGGVCSLCNRIRLTATGKVVSCLMSEEGYSIRELGIEEALKRAIINKPRNGKVNQMNTFYNLGG